MMTTATNNSMESRKVSLAQLRQRRFVNGLVVGLVGVAVGGAIVLFAGHLAGTAPVTIIRAEVYPLDDSPSQAAAFTGNDAIVLGTVTNLGPARWNTPDESERSLRMIFRPLDVRVEEVLKGDIKGATVIVRHIGGQVGNVKYVRDDLPPLERLARGTQVLLFLGPTADTGDGVPARTPNMWYVVKDGVAATPDGRHQIDLASFRELIAAAQTGE